MLAVGVSPGGCSRGQPTCVSPPREGDTKAKPILFVVYAISSFLAKLPRAIRAPCICTILHAGQHALPPWLGVTIY